MSGANLAVVTLIPLPWVCQASAIEVPNDLSGHPVGRCGIPD